MNVTMAALAVPYVLLAALPSASPPLDAARQALDRADERLAGALQEAGAVSAFSAFLADAAIFLEPDREVLRGKQAVLAALAETASLVPIRQTTLHRVGAAASRDGTLGYTFGWIERAPRHGPADYPKYLALWRAEADGWRVAAFATCRGDAPPSPAPPGAGAVAGARVVVSPGDPAKLADEIASADQAFASLAQRESVCAAFVGFADADAVVFRRADFGWGREAVRSAYSGCTPRTRATWTPVWSLAAASGDLGASIGNAVFGGDAESATASSPTYSKYLTIWARQADGTWKWLLDAGNARPAPSGGPT